MEVAIFRYRLKPGQKESWMEWCREAQGRAHEALEVMRTEGVTSESCFLSENDETVYLYYETENLARTTKLFYESKMPIALKHAQMLEQSLETRPARMKTLFSFQRSRD